jgi:hypothetical protein
MMPGDDVLTEPVARRIEVFIGGRPAAQVEPGSEGTPTHFFNDIAGVPSDDDPIEA